MSARPLAFRFPAIALLFLLFCPGPPAVDVQAQEPVFRSSVDQVRLDVLVTDGGLVVPGLTAADFQIFDNGVEQEPALATRAEGVSVLLVLDTSGSLTASRFRDQVGAARTVTDQVRAVDRIGLVTFATRPLMRVPPQLGTAGAQQVNDALDALTTGGTTAMRDGIVAGLRALDGAAGSALLLLFTDGDDNASTSTLDEVLEEVKRSRAVMGVVAVGLDDDPYRPFSSLDQRERTLRLIAEANGGPFLRAERDRRKIEEAFGRILEEFRGRYILSYTPRKVARDDGWHTVTVRVRQGRARTRAGYFAGRGPAFTTNLPIGPTGAALPVAAQNAHAASTPAGAPGATPPAPDRPPAPPPPGAFDSLDYAAIVSQYRSGAYEEAVDQVARRWPLERLKGKEGLASLPNQPEAIAAAALLHTDLALRGSAAHAEEQFDLAWGLVERLKKGKFDPAFRRTWLLLAESHFRAMTSRRSSQFLTLLTLEFENDPEVLVAAGSASERIGELSAKVPSGVWGPSVERAEACYRKALAADPSSGEARVRLGRVLSVLGRRDQALVELQRALRETRKPRIAYLAALFAGRLQEDAGRLADAAALYRFALTLVPGALSASIGLSHVLQMMNQPTAAVETIANSVRPPGAGTAAPADPFWFYPMGQYWRAADRIERMRTMVKP